MRSFFTKLVVAIVFGLLLGSVVGCMSRAKKPMSCCAGKIKKISTSLTTCPFGQPQCVCTEAGSACLLVGATSCCCYSDAPGDPPGICPVTPVGPPLPD